MTLKELSKELQHIEYDRKQGKRGLTVQELNLELKKIIEECSLQEK